MNETVWIPIEYQLKHIPPKHKTVYSVRVREDIPVQMPVADPGSFRRVGTMKRSSAEKFVATYSSDSGSLDETIEAVDLIKHQGQFYRSAISAYGGPLSSSTTTAAPKIPMREALEAIPSCRERSAGRSPPPIWRMS